MLLYRDPGKYIYHSHVETGTQNHGYDHGSVLTLPGKLRSDDPYPSFLPAQWTRGWSIHNEKKVFPKLTYLWGRVPFSMVSRHSDVGKPNMTGASIGGM